MIASWADLARRTRIAVEVRCPGRAGSAAGFATRGEAASRTVGARGVEWTCHVLASGAGLAPHGRDPLLSGRAEDAGRARIEVVVDGVHVARLTHLAPLLLVRAGSASGALGERVEVVVERAGRARLAVKSPVCAGDDALEVVQVQRGVLGAGAQAEPAHEVARARIILLRARVALRLAGAPEQMARQALRLRILPVLASCRGAGIADSQRAACIRERVVFVGPCRRGVREQQHGHRRRPHPLAGQRNIMTTTHVDERCRSLRQRHPT